MRNRTRISLIVLFTILTATLNSCLGTKKIESEKPVIRLKTTACSGTCPVFSLELYSNGIMILNGKAFIEYIGQYQGKLNDDQLNALLIKFDESNFFSFENKYTSTFMDLPAKYITYSKGDKSKEIMAYDNIPEELTDLINTVRELIDQVDWKKID